MADQEKAPGQVESVKLISTQMAAHGLYREAGVLIDAELAYLDAGAELLRATKIALRALAKQSQ